MRAQVIRGIRSSAGASVALTLIRAVQLVVLARLLDPTDFGLMAMIVVVIGLATLFSEMGIGTAIIHRETVDSRILSTLYWTSLVIGGGMTVLLWAGTPLIVRLYEETALIEPLGWIAWIFLVTAIGQQSQFLMEKELRFSELAGIEILATLAGAALAITAAMRGAGVLSLVWGALATAATKSVALLILHRWRPQLWWRAADLRGYVSFGAFLTGQRSLNFATANLDYLLIGRYLGSQPLGLYSVAYNLVNLPSSRINAVLNRVFFPVFVRLRDDPERLRSGYLRFQEFTSAVNLPLIALIVGLAPFAVPTLLGPRWREAVPLILILAIVGAGRAVAGTVGPLILTLGRVSLGFAWSILVICLQVPALIIGIRSGTVIGVATAFAVLTLVLVALNYRILVRPMIGPCLRDYVARIFPFVWMGGAATATMYAVGAARGIVSPYPLVAIQAIVGVAVYVALLFVHRPELLREMRGLARPVSFSESS